MKIIKNKVILSFFGEIIKNKVNHVSLSLRKICRDMYENHQK